MGKTIKYGIIILILTIMCIILYSFSFNRVNAETNTTTNDYEHKKLLIIDNKEYTYKLGPYIEYIEDKNNERSIEDISSGKLEKEFKRSKTEKLRFGYTSSTYWLRFKIKNRIKDFDNWIIKIAYNMLDRVELFIPTESGTYIKKVAGDTIPLRKKELKHKDIAFPISLENNTEKTYYMKIQTTGSMSISPSIMSDKVFFYNDNNIQLFYGFIFGGFVTLILFNIFIFSSTGDRSYLHYILFISFLLLFYLIDTGYGYKLFWSDLPWFNTLYPVAGNLTGVFLILFSIKFLQTSKYTPIFNNLLMVVFVSGTLSAIISLFISYRIAVIIFLVNQIIAIFLLPLTSIRSWIRGNKIARFYVIAWIIFFVGILISNSIQLLNLISKDYFLLDNIYIIASHISLILFSFALADKINLMRKKTEETSRRLNNLNIYLEKKVEERTSEYEEKNKELESFSSIVAHDLRNPLSVIISAVNLINKKYIDKVPDKVKHILDMLSERTERIVKMINAIQRYSSINKEKLVLQICDINEIIKIAIENLGYSINKKKAKIHFDTDMPKIKCDKYQFISLFQNLIGNSLKYCGKDKKPEIHIGAEEKDNEYLFKIKDNGIGIGAEYKDKIFEMFNRINTTSDEYSGSGVGLAFCKKIVETHKGKIWVDSEPGKGSTFYFTISKVL